MGVRVSIKSGYTPSQNIPAPTNPFGLIDFDHLD